MIDLLEWDRQSEAATWQIIGHRIGGLNESLASQIDVQELLSPPIYEKLATLFLQRQKADRTWQFLSTDQLIAIASKTESSEIDIDQVSGVYVFCSLLENRVLKVGQTSDLRRRIATEHLRKGSMNTGSLLIDHAMRTWSVSHDSAWHASLGANEVTALLFPMRGSGEVDRLIIEHSLEGILSPVMP